MAIDPRTPVIVGVAQMKRRPAATDDLVNIAEPAEMMAEVARSAAEDSGAGEKLLAAVGSIRVMGLLSWGYTNPGALVASRLGIDVKESVLTNTGGNGPQVCVNDAAEAILDGHLDAALIVGAEAVFTRHLASRATPPVSPHWTRRDDETAGPPTMMGDDTQGSHPAEMARSLVVPIQIYPVFENAIRGAEGRSVAEQSALIAGLWSKFSEVAAKNPTAWSPTAMSAEEIGTPTPSNRMVCFPYTKLLNANIQTDQAAALIMCSVETARAAGIDKDKWVFVRAGAEAHDHWFVSERDNLYSSPAIRLAGERALKCAGIELDDIGYFDLYSCFPSAVQIAAKALKIKITSEKRPLTVTGGLGFAGGPGNNYVTHSIATMTQLLRSDPGSIGLLNAVGWYLTKHAVGIYSTEPGDFAFQRENVQKAVDTLPKRNITEDAQGKCKIESYTVAYDRSGNQEKAIVACMLPDGSRTWANSSDPALMEAMTTESLNGKTANLLEGGIVELD